MILMKKRTKFEIATVILCAFCVALLGAGCDSCDGSTRYVGECSYPDCTEITSEIYCYKHQCQYRTSNGAYCKNARVIGSNYCELHAKSAVPCSFEGCTEFVFNENTDLCDIHANKSCKFSSGMRNCRELALSDSDYCRRHTCSIKGCTSIIAPTYGGKYSTVCLEHWPEGHCAAEGCDRIGEWARKGVTDKSRYCWEHMCKETGCKNQSLEGQQYCGEHLEGTCVVCDLPVFHSRAGYKQKGCFNHTCHDPYCNELALNCYVDDFYSGEGIDRNYCSYHAPNMPKSVE